MGNVLGGREDKENGRGEDVQVVNNTLPISLLYIKDIRSFNLGLL